MASKPPRLGCAGGGRSIASNLIACATEARWMVPLNGGYKPVCVQHGSGLEGKLDPETFMMRYLEIEETPDEEDV